MNIKTKVVAALALAVFVLPGVTFAQSQSVAVLQQEIAALTAQLTQLESQLSAAGGSTAVWCYSFGGNLSIGMSGAAVTALQTALQKDGESVTVNGTFDDQTAAAVTGFQEKYSSAILAPYSLSNGTGYVGGATRAKLNSLFSCGGPVPAPVGPTPVNPTPAPTTLGTQTYTNSQYGVSFSYPSNYIVKYGDAAFGTSNNPLGDYGIGLKNPSFTSLITIETPANLYPDTNFEGGFFNVSVAPQLGASQCSAVNAQGSSQGIKIVDGASFSWTGAGSAAAGTDFVDYNASGYTNGICYVAKEGYMVGNGALGLKAIDGSTITVFNEGGLITVLNNMLSTVRFTAPQPTSPSGNGVLTGSISPNTPASSYLGMGMTGVVLAQYQFTADANSNETLTQVSIADSSSAGTVTPSTDHATFVNYRLTDTTGNVLAAGVENASGMIQFNLSGLIVPANGSELVNLQADVNAYPYATSGATHAFALNSYQYANGVAAVTATGSNVIGNLFTVYRTTLNAIAASFANPTSISAAGTTVGAFTFIAGNSNGNALVKTVTLSTRGSAIQYNTAQSFGLYDMNNPGAVLATGTAIGAANVTFNLQSGSSSLSLPAGTSRTLLVKMLAAPAPLPVPLPSSSTLNYEINLVGATWSDGVTANISSSMPVAGQLITGLSGSTTTAALNVSASQLNFSLQQWGSTTSPLSAVVQVTGPGNQSVNWVSQNSANWLLVTPQTIPQSTGPATIAINTNAIASFAPGTYTGTVTFSSVGFLPASVSVVLTISPGTPICPVWGCTAPPSPIATTTPSNVPYILGIDPASVLVPGGAVILEGSNFDSGSYVDLDGVQSINPSSYASTSLDFTLTSNVSVGSHALWIAEKASNVTSNQIAFTVSSATSTTHFVACPMMMPYCPNGGHTVVESNGCSMMVCNSNTVTSTQSSASDVNSQTAIVSQSLQSLVSQLQSLLKSL